MTEELHNDDNEGHDAYGPREPSDQDTVGPTLDYGPPADIDPQRAMDEWQGMRGETAQADLDSCIWLVENFCPEKIEALSDPRNLSHDLELGADLISIYSEAMDKMEQEDKGLNYQTVTQQQPNSRQQADIRQKVEMAIFSAEQRHAARSSRYSK